MRLIESKPDPDLSGKTLGDYVLLRRLGRGGMADVYLAEQQSLRRQVAFKVLHANLACDDAYVKRFHNEAQAVAALVHANIVQIHEVGQLDGIHFIAQEYVAGQNLHQLLRRRGVLSGGAALNVMRCVAAALHRANERGIVHRDIKPENILLGSNGDVKVADFGLARVAESGDVRLTQVGMALGTPLYMSPEQAEGKHCDHRSDLYSLGVTCYEMLSGRPPFEGNTALSIAVQHLKSEPKPLLDRRPDLPSSLAGIVHRLLAKRPADRYQTAEELLVDLRAANVNNAEGDWPEDVGEPSSADMNAPAQVTATEQLQTVMLTETRMPRSSRSRIYWIMLAACAAFVFGGVLAWVTRPAYLLARNGAPVIERFDTAAEQFAHAMMVEKGPLEEAALKSVIKYFGKDTSPDSVLSVQKAKLHLAYYYHDQGRLDTAKKLFAEVAEQGSDIRLRMMALIRHANICSAQHQLAAASKSAFKLVQLLDEADQLPPVQRVGLRREITRGLDPDVLAEFRRHLGPRLDDLDRRDE